MILLGRAAQDLNMPPSLHILTGREGIGIDFFASDRWLRGSTLHHEVERSVVVFMFDKVFLCNRLRDAIFPWRSRYLVLQHSA